MSEEFIIKKYAIVSDGIVANTIFTEPGFIEMISSNTIVDITDEAAAADISCGYIYENGVFSAPVE